MHRRIAPVVSSALISAFLLHSNALAYQDPSAPLYHVEEIDRSAWGLTIPNDINNRGVIVGEWDSGTNFGDPRHAVVWRNGVRVDLTPEAEISSGSATGVNDRGLVVGWYDTDASYPSGGFRWRQGTFDVLPTFAPGHQRAHGVSENGLVLGRAMHEHFQTNATVWDESLNDIDLGSLGPGIGLVHDANGWDWAVGASGVSLQDTHAFISRNGTLHDIGALPGYPIGRAQAINNHNEVVGYSGAPLNDHAFYWSPSTGMIELSNLGFPLGASANDINDQGVIIGYSDSATSRVGVVWHEHVPHDLNDLLVNGQGWEIQDANGINELGQIVGHGRLNGQSVGYLATPVGVAMTTIIGPEPAVAGVFNGVDIVEATPNAEVLVYYGPEAASSTIAEATQLSYEFEQRHSVTVHVDEQGQGRAIIRIPRQWAGEKVLFQALDRSNGRRTNLIVRTMR